jgi:hypothetical protein
MLKLTTSPCLQACSEPRLFGGNVLVTVPTFANPSASTGGDSTNFAWPRRSWIQLRRKTMDPFDPLDYILLGSGFAAIFVYLGWMIVRFNRRNNG